MLFVKETPPMERDSLPPDLAPHEPVLSAIVREGLALFQERFGAIRAGMSTSAERNNIHDCMKETARRLCPELCRQKGQLFLLCIGPYRIKLKKLNSRLTSSNYPTQAVFDFLRQKFYSLFDDAALINLQLGYVPDDIALVASPVWVTCPSGVGKLSWWYSVPEGGISTRVEIPPATNPDVPKEKRVRPKRVKQPKIERAGKQ